MVEPAPEVRWTVAQRFEFIEWRAYWSGRVNRKDLEEKFQISTQQASIDLGNYQEAARGNIEYSPTEKTYLATRDFRPRFLKLSPERYLLQLQALTADAIRKSDTWFDQVPPAEVTPTIVRGPEAHIVRAIVRAIEMGGSVNVNYQSLTRTGVRTICPHAFVHDGYRWHARALSVEHGQFRDYVLGRILSIDTPVPCDANPSDDIEWQTQITLRITAHPKLSDEQKETIEHDHRMKEGELAIQMRLALAYYFIKRYLLDLRAGEIEPNRAQLYLKNYDEVMGAITAAKEQSKTLVAARRSLPRPSA